MESGFPLPKVTGEIPNFRTMASLHSTLAQPCSTPLRLKLASTKGNAMVGGPSGIMPSIQDRLCHMWWFTCTSEVMNKIEWLNKNKLYFHVNSSACNLSSGTDPASKDISPNASKRISVTEFVHICCMFHQQLHSSSGIASAHQRMPQPIRGIWVRTSSFRYVVHDPIKCPISHTYRLVVL